MNTKIAYHFVGETLRDGRPIPADGEWLEHDGEIGICSYPFGALKYALGSTLCLVEVDGDISEYSDNLVGRRRIIARIDAAPLLREFARWCALQVIDLWDAPDVVRQYLVTGDESIRAAALAEALAVKRAAAYAAAWAAESEEAIWDTLSAARAAAGAVDIAEASEAAEAAARAAQRDKFNEMVTAAFAKHI